jgi:hypothetical protein
MGASADVFGCDITNYDCLASTLALVSSKLSIKGLIHAAMVEGVSSNHIVFGDELD